MSSSNFSFPILPEGDKGGQVKFNHLVLAISENVHCVTVDRVSTVPPDPGVEGTAYLVQVSGQGPWFGHDNEIAYFYNGWRFLVPRRGFLVWDLATDCLFTFDENEWHGAAIVLDIAGGASLPTIKTKANELFAVCRDHGLIA